MKKINIVLSLLALVIGLQFSSCGKGGNNPVDQYVSILDDATKKTEKVSSFAELTNIQQIISPEEAQKVIMENADYVLTDKDKEKIKKSFDKLLKVAYEKTTEYGGIPEEAKEVYKSQVDMILQAANTGIDHADKLGDLIQLR